MITAAEEWNDLAREWQAVKDRRPVAPTLMRHAQAHRRRMQWLIPLEALILTGALAVLAAWLRARPSAWPWVLYALFFAAAICGFAIWNRRGTWAASANTHRAYFALCVLRCRRQLRAARFTAVVTGAHLLAVGIAVLVRDVPPGRMLRAFMLIAAYAVAYGGGAWIIAVRARHDLAWLEERFGREDPVR